MHAKYNSLSQHKFCHPSHPAESQEVLKMQLCGTLGSALIGPELPAARRKTRDNQLDIQRTQIMRARQRQQNPAPATPTINSAMTAKSYHFPPFPKTPQTISQSFLTKPPLTNKQAYQDNSLSDPPSFSFSPSFFPSFLSLLFESRYVKPAATGIVTHTEPMKTAAPISSGVGIVDSVVV